MRGGNGNKLISSAEVYDPEENTWTSIMPMRAARARHSVEVHGGYVDRHSNRLLDPTDDDDENYGRPAKVAKFMEVYDSLNNKWRLERSIRWNKDDLLFVAKGRFYSMTLSAIHAYVAETSSWTVVHSFLFPCLEGVEF